MLRSPCRPGWLPSGLLVHMQLGIPAFAAVPTIHNAASQKVLGLIFIAEEKAEAFTSVRTRAAPGMWGP